MILNEYITINNKKLKKYYGSIGYDVSGDNSIIKIIDLPQNSHYSVDVGCDVCGKIKKTKWYNYYKNTNGLREDYCCSKKCANNKCKQRLQDKYGVDNVFQLEEIKQKSKKTLINKYGAEHPMQSDEIKQKLINTNLEKWGCEYVLSSPIINDKKKNTNLEKYGNKTPLLNSDIKDKIRETLINKYGVEHPMQSDEIKQKLVNTNLEKWGVKNIFQNKSIMDDTRAKSNITKYKLNKKLYGEKYGIRIVDYNNIDKTYAIKCQLCDHDFMIEKTLLQNRLRLNTQICVICNPIGTHVSGLEIELLNFIKNNYGGIIIENTKGIISPYELDIYLPDLGLAFEFNGVYWHNELYCGTDYHRLKTDLCLDKNIQLIHIYEDDWKYKQDIVKSMILNRLNRTPNKISARKCEIMEITDNKLVKKFLDNNHIQGFVGSGIKIGLFYGDDLVSIMTFGKLRKPMHSKSKDINEYEMLRFCNRLGTNVIGGASKLFTYFIKNHNPETVVSYADRGYSNGNLYLKLGFRLEHITKPNYQYIIDGIRKYRFGFRKECLIKQGFDPNKSEREIMLGRKIYRIYNSGNLKFKFYGG